MFQWLIFLFRIVQSLPQLCMHGQWFRNFDILNFTALVRKEIADETDRATGRTKQISTVPIYLSIYSPNGKITILAICWLSLYSLVFAAIAHHISNIQLQFCGVWVVVVLILNLNFTTQLLDYWSTTVLKETLIVYMALVPIKIHYNLQHPHH